MVSRNPLAMSQSCSLIVFNVTRKLVLYENIIDSISNFEETMNMNDEKRGSDIYRDIIMDNNVIAKVMDINEEKIYVNLEINENERFNIDEHNFDVVIGKEVLVVKTSLALNVNVILCYLSKTNLTIKVMMDDFSIHMQI